MRRHLLRCTRFVALGSWSGPVRRPRRAGPATGGLRQSTGQTSQAPATLHSTGPINDPCIPPPIRTPQITPDRRQFARRQPFNCSWLPPWSQHFSRRCRRRLRRLASSQHNMIRSMTMSQTQESSNPYYQPRCLRNPRTVTRSRGLRR